jgi:hypothetical protein
MKFNLRSFLALVLSPKRLPKNMLLLSSPSVLLGEVFRGGDVASELKTCSKNRHKEYQFKHEGPF